MVHSYIPVGKIHDIPRDGKSRVVDYIPLVEGTTSDGGLIREDIIMRLLGIRWLLLRMGVEVEVVPSRSCQYMCKASGKEAPTSSLVLSAIIL